MAGSLRKELDSLMKAQMEQTEIWHTVMASPGDMIDLPDSVRLLIDWNAILRKAILRLAEEIDRIDGPDEN